MVWVVKGERLTARVVWHDERAAVLSKSSDLEISQGPNHLPVRVAAGGEVLADVAPSISGRGQVEDRYGSLVIPAMCGSTVLAVLELRSCEAVQVSERMMRSLTGIAHELGHFLVQRRGELGSGILTSHQAEVLSLAAQGYAPREIAERLCISRSTVKRHFEHIYVQLGVSDRAAAVAAAMRAGLIG